jgi:putative nucleotidyltransferase with HDIG domain
MNRLSFIGDSTFEADRLRRQLAGIFDVQFVDPARLREEKPDRFTVVSTNLHDASLLLDIKEWMRSKPRGGKVIFVTTPNSRMEATQAFALGATDVVSQPIDTKELLKKLWSDFTALAGDKSDFKAHDHGGAAAAQDSLQEIFASACLGEAIKPTMIVSASAAVVNEIESRGLSSWINAVRKHHSQTYQHCLLVTGVATAFGQHLGLSQADRSRLSFAGMLHDIGKARIPVAILEKPGPLNGDEIDIMRKHPEYGLEALSKSADELGPEMRDIVIHHHEYLDGSGYPHGLQGNEIADLVRIMTIADVYGALIERRAYKPPMSSQQAYDVLHEMGPKLDKDLVREFRFVTKGG